MQAVLVVKQYKDIVILKKKSFSIKHQDNSLGIEEMSNLEFTCGTVNYEPGPSVKNISQGLVIYNKLSLLEKFCFSKLFYTLELLICRLQRSVLQLENSKAICSQTGVDTDDKCAAEEMWGHLLSP